MERAPNVAKTPGLGALSNRLLELYVCPRFEELTNMLEIHSNERL